MTPASPSLILRRPPEAVPRTASALPTVALIGLVSLGIALAARALRIGLY
jgi:hypothetical protein